jgi:hypothetical protein
MLRAVRAILHGPLPDKWSGVADASHLWRRLPFIILLGALMLFGFFPRLLVDKIEPSVGPIVAKFAEVGSPAFGRPGATMAYDRRYPNPRPPEGGTPNVVDMPTLRGGSEDFTLRN